jgi:hypothetical protein
MHLFHDLQKLKYIMPAGDVERIPTLPDYHYIYGDSSGRILYMAPLRGI